MVVTQFRETFASESNWQKIIWNNKEIRIDKKPVYFKNYYESGIVCVNDLLVNISTNDSFDYFANQIRKINILQWWAGLRHSIPDLLKGDYTSPPLTSPSFLIHNNIFDVTKKKSKDFYLLLVTEKAQPPNISKWKSYFNLSVDNLREFFLLRYSVVLESYVKAFQYKMLHNIL